MRGVIFMNINEADAVQIVQKNFVHMRKIATDGGYEATGGTYYKVGEIYFGRFNCTKDPSEIDFSAETLFQSGLLTITISFDLEEGRASLSYRKNGYERECSIQLDSEEKLKEVKEGKLYELLQEAENKLFGP